MSCFLLNKLQNWGYFVAFLQVHDSREDNVVLVQGTLGTGGNVTPGTTN